MYKMTQDIVCADRHPSARERRDCLTPATPSSYVRTSSALERNRLQHMLHGNTDTHVTLLPPEMSLLPHQDFLDSLPEGQRPVAEALLRQALSPPNPGFCKARVYAGACQCSRKPLWGQDFCREHAQPQLRAKHGVQGNPLPLPHLHARVTAKLRHFHATQERSSGYKWFSRHRLWLFAEGLGLAGVADLADADYLRGLRSVHEFFTRHASARHQLDLVPFAGPQGLMDRGSHKEDALGTLKLFPFYDHRVFCSSTAKR